LFGAETKSNEAPAKECPKCQSLIACGFTRCPDCGYEFPPPERKEHDPKAATVGIISGQATLTEHVVNKANYYVHRKYGADEKAPKTMKVEYEIGWHRYQSEWICFEHTGYAREKAEAWWRKRSYTKVPQTAEAAVALAKAGALARTHAIAVRKVAGQKYDRIASYKIGEKPQFREPGWEEETVNDESLVSMVEAYADEELPF